MYASLSLDEFTVHQTGRILFWQPNNKFFIIVPNLKCECLKHHHYLHWSGRMNTIAFIIRKSWVCVVVTEDHTLVITVVNFYYISLWSISKATPSDSPKRKWFTRCVGHPWQRASGIYRQDFNILICFQYRTYFHAFSVGIESPLAFCIERSNQHNIPNSYSCCMTFSRFYFDRQFSRSLARNPMETNMPRWAKSIYHNSSCRLQIFTPIQSHLTLVSGEVVVDEMACACHHAPMHTIWIVVLPHTFISVCGTSESMKWFFRVSSFASNDKN